MRKVIICWKIPFKTYMFVNFCFHNLLQKLIKINFKTKTFVRKNFPQKNWEYRNEQKEDVSYMQNTTILAISITWMRQN